jgi:cell division protein FtsW (lipid II flippase)
VVVKSMKKKLILPALLVVLLISIVIFYMQNPYACTSEGYQVFFEVEASEDQIKMYIDPWIKNCTDEEVTFYSGLPVTRVLITQPNGEESIFPLGTKEMERI